MPGFDVPLADGRAGCDHPLSLNGEVSLMAKVGDRIRLSSMKGPDREGVVTAVTGSLMRVRWLSGEETTMVPAPGTLTVLAATTAEPRTTAAKKGAAKKTAAARKTTSKRSAPKKQAAGKTKGAKRPAR